MTMRMRQTEYPHIFWNEDKHLPCIEGTRLRVQDVVAHHKAGRSIQAIAADFPPHTRAEICSALAYYYDHQDQYVQVRSESGGSRRLPCTTAMIWTRLRSGW
jgi:uncharacterized protein (DUF433 family)